MSPSCNPGTTQKKRKSCTLYFLYIPTNGLLAGCSMQTQVQTLADPPQLFQLPHLPRLPRRPRLPLLGLQRTNAFRLNVQVGHHCTALRCCDTSQEFRCQKKYGKTHVVPQPTATWSNGGTPPPPMNRWHDYHQINSAFSRWDV